MNDGYFTQGMSDIHGVHSDIHGVHSEHSKKRFILIVKYSVIQKDGLNFVRLYFLNYTWYVNDLHNISKRKS